MDAQLREIRGAGVACVRVRLCTMRHMCETRGEYWTHACHFYKTHDNTAKMECQLHQSRGTLGKDAQLREITGAGVACVRVKPHAL